jgi:hypothetical protein
MDYTYDDLYRLETAASTDFTLGDYSRNYAYDEVGNMICKSDLSYSEYPCSKALVIVEYSY